MPPKFKPRRTGAEVIPDALGILEDDDLEDDDDEKVATDGGNDRSLQYNLRLTPAERERFMLAARESGQTLSAWMRRAAHVEADEAERIRDRRARFADRQARYERRAKNHTR
jgi:hypothetical protein